MYERLIGPRGITPERVTILDDPVLSTDLRGRTDQLRLYVLRRPQVVMILGAQPFTGIQGEESVLHVLSPVPKKSCPSSERKLYAEINPSIVTKLVSKKKELLVKDFEPGDDTAVKVARIDKALAVIDPSGGVSEPKEDFWRTAFWAKDLYTGYSVESFQQAAMQAELAAQMRLRYSGTLSGSVNEWWVYGGDFATWVMETKRPDLKRRAYVEFKKTKSWQIFNNEMAALDQQDSALTVFPGSRVTRYWKGDPEFKDDPLYKDIAWPLRYEAFSSWAQGRPFGHFHSWWSVSPNAEQQVNQVLRTMFAYDIKPLYREGVDPLVISDDQTRVDFLRQGVSNWMFADNIERAAIDRLNEIGRRPTPEHFLPVLRTAVDLAVAYPQKRFPIAESDKFISAYEGSVATLQELLRRDEKATGRNLVLYSDFLSAGRIIYGQSEFSQTDTDLVARLIRLRNKLDADTNRDPDTDKLLLLGKIQANLIILGSTSAIPTTEGLRVENQEARDPFNKDNWLIITPTNGKSVLVS
jgi:hypothetical protein